MPVDARLSPETRAYLHSLTVNTQDILVKGEAVSVQEHAVEETLQERNEASECVITADHQREDEPVNQVHDASDQVEDRDDYHRVEIPLRHDHEFFQMLRSGVLRINTLQTQEKGELTKEIESLGREIAKIATWSHNSGSTDMYLWREIFSLYTNSQVFFSTSEQKNHTRDVQTAEKQLQHFSNKLRELNSTQNFRRKESYPALDRFLHMNIMLFRNLRFQELNTKAMAKILKSE